MGIYTCSVEVKWPPLRGGRGEGIKKRLVILSLLCIFHVLILKCITLFSGLCSWVINIIRFFEVYCDVEPKRRALEEANAELAAAQTRLTSITSKIKVRIDLTAS